MNRRGLGFLGLLWLLLALGLSGTGWVYYQREYQSLVRQREDELKAIGAMKLEQIVSWQRERKADAWLAASPHGAGEVILRGLAGKRTDAALREDLSAIRAAYHYLNILVFESGGTLRFALVPHGPHTAKDFRALVARAVAERRAIAGDLYRDPDHGEIVIDHAAPVFDTDGVVRAVLVLQSDAVAQLFPIVQSWPTRSPTGETLLVRREGDMVLFLNALRHLKTSPLAFHTPMARQDLPGAQALLGRTGTFHGNDYRGVPVMADLRQVPGTAWAMITKVDAQEILAEARYRGRVILGFVGLGLVLVAALVFGGFYLAQARVYQDMLSAMRHGREPDMTGSLASGWRAVPWGAGIASMGVGVTVLVGWAFDVASLKSVLPGFVTMKANTALGLILAGTALLLNMRREKPAVAIRVVSCLLALLGGATLLQYLTGWNIGIDQWLFSEAPGGIGTLAPGRMSPATAFNFTLLGIALADARLQRLRRVTAVLVGLSGMLSLLGYAYGSMRFHGIGHYLQLALHTAVVFMVLGAGLALADHPLKGWVRRLLAQTPGGVLLRSTLPILVGFPLLLEWARHLVQKQVQFPGPDLLAGMVLSVMALLVTSAAWIAKSLDSADAIRREAEAGTLARTEEMRALLYSIGDGVIATDPAGQVIHMNPVAETLTGWIEAEVKGRSLAEFLVTEDPETREHQPDPVTRVLQEGRMAPLRGRSLLVARDGVRRVIAHGVSPVYRESGALVQMIMVFHDWTEEHRMERLAQIRLELNEFSNGHTLGELLTQTLDHMGAIVGSPIGFYHFFDEDTGNITLQQWSTRTRKDYCKAEGEGSHYPLAKAGVWVECVRQRRPVVHNDYASLPYKRGLPPGHAELVRELVVPVFRQGRIVAILGVGNKEVDYTDKDVDAVTFLADVTWDIIHRKQVEAERAEALREALRLKNAMDHLPVYVYLKDLNRRYIYANTQTLALFGGTAEALFDHADVNLFPPETLAHVAQVDARVLEGGEDTAEEVIAQTHDGQWRTYWEVKSPIRDEAGRICGLCGISTDITERKQMEESLKASEFRAREALRLLEGLVDAIPDVIGIQKLDHTVLRYNAAGYALLGKVPEEVIGKKCFELLGRINPCELCATEAAVRGKRTVTLEKFLPELGVWIDARSYPILGDDGEVTTIIEHLRDITELKRQEAQLLAKTELLNLTGRMAKVGGWEFDAKTFSGSWTDEVARIHDLEPGLPVTALDGLTYYSEPSQPLIERAVHEAATLGIPYDLELELVSAKGVLKMVRTLGQPVRDANGHVVKVRGILMDITEKKASERAIRTAQEETERLLKVAERSRHALLSLVEDQRQAEEEIRRLNADLEKRVEARTQDLAFANRELEAFAYSVSHDLRAPLRHMEGFLTLLARHLGSHLDERGDHYLQVATKAASRMGQLIDGLLSFSRLGRTELHRVPVDLGSMVAQVIDELRIDVAQRTIHWKVGSLPEIHGDPVLIRLVFQNLIGNAVKFTRQRAEAVIEIEAIEDLVGESGVSIRDNGIGFDPAYAHKLFGVFQRLHREDEFEGTGIGLANVHRIVTRHGGRVWAGGRPGEGAVFCVAFPDKGTP